MNRYGIKRKINWRRVICPVCGQRITNNALGREAHIRNCKGRTPAPATTQPRRKE